MTIKPLRSETREQMLVDWDVPIEMDDGLILRCDVYRPPAPGRYPVLLSHGPYAKLLHFEDGYVTAWQKMVADYPEVVSGSSSRFQAWEVADPEKWIPHGYVCVRVDSRGAGRSPGKLDPRSPRETADFAACIEWAGMQDWSNGRVGLNGISYYAINQWQVAALQPKHLHAMCAWEGANDSYREFFYHGGIYSTFAQNWYDMQLKSVQNGLGERGPRSRMNGELVAGPNTLTEEELASNRIDMGRELLEHPLDDDYHRERSADLSKVVVPVLTAANWGGQGLHTRGNFEGFMRAASPQKWLEVHGIEHWTHFYTDYGLDLQRRFFDHFLKLEDNGWDRQPPVTLQVRHPGERFEKRSEIAWPIPQTGWERFYLEPEAQALGREPSTTAATVSFAALGDGVTFISPPFPAETEFTGPITARLNISSTTSDADLFVVVKLYAPDLKEITFRGALDPKTPIAQGWLRASHRALDQEKSLPFRPWHSHSKVEPLVPGEVYPVEVEIWPTSIVVPIGYRIGVSIRGRDYVYSGGPSGGLSNMKNRFSGCGPFLHDDARDRPAAVFGGETRLHFGESLENYMVMPLILASRG
jgi:predicted acyl esterase